MSDPGRNGQPPGQSKRDRILRYVRRFQRQGGRIMTQTPSVPHTSIQEASKATSAVFSQSDSAPDIPGTSSTVQEPSTQEHVARDLPSQELPPIPETPVEETPVQETHVQETHVQETHVQETSVQEAPVQDTPLQELSAQGTSDHEPSIQESQKKEPSVHARRTRETSGRMLTSCSAPGFPSSTCRPAAPTSLWKEALEKLEQRDRDSIMTMQSSQEELDDVNDLINKLDQKRQEWLDTKWTMQTKNGIISYRAYADKVIGVLQSFKGVGDTLVQYDPVHAAIPWAGARFLIQLLVSESEQTQFLLEISDRITLFTSTCRIYESLYTTDTIKAPVFLEGLRASLINLYIQILKTTARSHRLLSQRTTRRVLSAIVPMWKEDLKKLEALYHSVMQATGLCDKQLTAETSQMQNNLKAKVDKFQEFLRTLDSSLSKLDSKVDNISAKVNSTSEKVNNALEKVDAYERTRILDWTSSVAFGSDHQRVREHWAPGTCEWLPQDSRFRSWNSSADSGLLVLFGSPGTGKTFLTSQVIDYITRDGIPQDKAFAYFYCDRNDSKRNNPTAIFQTWLRQLAAPESAKDKLHPDLRKAWQDGQVIGISHLQFSSCEDMIARLTQDFTRTTLILDALDECVSRRRLLTSLGAILKRSTKPIKIFISSRPDVEITTTLQAWPRISRVEIQASNNSGDMKKFFTAEIERHERYWVWEDMNQEMQEKILGVLDAKNHGMFQWAKLQIDQLLCLGTDEDILARLGKLPKDLKATYDDLYAHLGEEYTHQRRLANRAIQWVSSSQEPLEEKVLLWAISQDPDAEVISRIRFSSKQVLDSTRNLLGLVEAWSGQRFWRLSHLSVAEYFEDNHANLFGPAAIHSQVAAVALMTLMSQSTSGINIQHLVGRDVWDSILQSWPLHVSQAGRDASPRLVSLLKEFLGSLSSGSNDYQRWTMTTGLSGRGAWEDEMPMFGICAYGIFQPLHDWWQDLVLEGPLLHASHRGECIAQVAIRKNHEELWRRLIPATLESSTPEEKSCLGADFLSTAAANDSLNALKFLLDSGVECDAKGSLGYSALGAAALKGSIQAMELLLTHGADVNISCTQDNGSVLALAVRSRNYHVAQLLLQHGAEVNQAVQHGTYGSALVLACCIGVMEIVQLLLDNGGADVHLVVEHGNYGNALVAACAWGEAEIVRLLLDKGADVHTVLEYGKYGSALVAACFWGGPGFVLLLLEEGANVNQALCYGDYGSALAAACFWGDPEIVRLLLDKGANINQVLEHGNYASALVAACVEGEKEIVGLLLEKGANVNQVLERGDYGNALVAACVKREKQIVRLLLDKGADVNQVLEHGIYSNIWVAAFVKGDMEIMWLLWDAGAKVHQVPDYGDYGIVLAVPEFVQLLLDEGVNVNQVLEHGDYGSLLGAACAEREKQTVRLLLDKGANVNQVLEYGRHGSALVAACASKETGIVRLLLEEGANVNQVLDYGLYRSALVAACVDVGQHGSVLAAARPTCKMELVWLLLDRGAKVNQVLEHDRYGSALVAACAMGDKWTVALLLEKKAMVNVVVAGQLKTALSAALSLPWNAQYSARNRRLILSALLAAGADRSLLSEEERAQLVEDEELFAQGRCKAGAGGLISM